jgi:hyaluronan synthase
MWLYGIPFCFFYMFILVWQLPWAILTFREIKWGTRA